MRYLPSLRSVPSFGLRLGLGVRLLFGSAGLALAIAVLLSLAMYASRAVHMPERIATTTSLSVPELSLSTPVDTGIQLLATQAPTKQLGYSFASSCLPQGRVGLLPGPAPYRFALVGPGTVLPYATTETTPLSVLQRSWLTVKTMFR